MNNYNPKLDIEKFSNYTLREEHHTKNINQLKQEELKIKRNALLNFCVSKKLLEILSTKPQEEQINTINELEQRSIPHTSPYMKRHTDKYSLNPEDDLKNFLKKILLLKRIILANDNIITSKVMLKKYTIAQLLERWFWPFPKAPMWYQKNNNTLKLDKENASFITEWLEKFAKGEIETPREFGIFLFENLNWKPGEEYKYKGIAWKIFNDHDKLFLYDSYLRYEQYGIDYPVKWNHPAIISLDTHYNISKRRYETLGKKEDKKDLKILEEIIKSEAVNIPEITDEQKYMNLITEANKLYNLGNDTEALSRYQEALKLFPDNIHPQNRINEINLKSLWKYNPEVHTIKKPEHQKIKLKKTPEKIPEIPDISKIDLFEKLDMPEILEEDDE